MTVENIVDLFSDFCGATQRCKDCKLGADTTTQTECYMLFAYQQGKQDVLKELEQYRFGSRGGLVHWQDIEMLKEQNK